MAILRDHEGGHEQQQQPQRSEMSESSVQPLGQTTGQARMVTRSLRQAAINPAQRVQSAGAVQRQTQPRVTTVPPRSPLAQIPAIPKKRRTDQAGPSRPEEDRLGRIETCIENLVTAMSHVVRRQRGDQPQAPHVETPPVREPQNIPVHTSLPGNQPPRNTQHVDLSTQHTERRSVHTRLSLPHSQRHNNDIPPRSQTRYTQVPPPPVPPVGTSRRAQAPIPSLPPPVPSVVLLPRQDLRHSLLSRRYSEASVFINRQVAAHADVYEREARAARVENELQELRDQFNVLQAGQLALRPSQPLHLQEGWMDSPFSDEILDAQLPHDFKMPSMDRYEGKGDPLEHLSTFRAWMDLEGVSHLAMCRVFPLTLGGPARTWYTKLQPGSIHSFAQLGESFTAKFLGSKALKKPSLHLLSIVQKHDESLRSYIQRFNTEISLVDKASDDVIINNFIAGLRNEHFLRKLTDQMPQTFP